ncbi:histidine kinase [Pareuzebyella sediminis]|uniref:histidine kinase n=1 Tax=Pareuzebyella sediminis TaxID=2607998 RepID=UPI0011EC43C3|nr:histidine kinase [Pareuzebyella sediminis]
MYHPRNIVFIILLTCASLSGQVDNGPSQVLIRGSVKEKATDAPISGVVVSTDRGAYTQTNGLGEYTIKAFIGDELTFRSPEFLTKRHIIRSEEDVDVVVEENGAGGQSLREARADDSSMHRTYLDSANFYKKTDIEKSIGFIAQSLAVLGTRSDQRKRAESLVALGDAYRYYNQYDLAIENYRNALDTNKSSRTTLLLAETYIQNNQFREAETILNPLLKIKTLIPYQRVWLYENLGDAYKGLHEIDKAVAFYDQGLKIAKKNQISPKLADLNSKIADAYAEDDRLQEADAYYNSSLEISKTLAPQRSVQEKEKVADFYNQKNEYNDEIALRKKSLNELKTIPKVNASQAPASVQPDSITAQRINFKIAKAYIAQDKYDEAIPYLKESIEEANTENDLVVQKDATRKLSEIFERKGDYTKAFETYRDYVALVDTLYVRKEQEISRAARLNREISVKQNRISGLEQERQLSQSRYDLALTEQQLVQETNRRQKWVIYSLVLGLILLGLATFFFYRSNKQQKLANNLLALKSLRSQMNPHFIFNALNSVNNYISKSDERSANRFLSEFSVLMRSVLENSEEDFIPLSKELELLELYVKLEHSRFPEKFDYKLNIADDVAIESFQIPPMLLQPYIENAIWHGLRYKKGKGFLGIQIRQSDSSTMEITIEDNGIGRKQSTTLKTKNQKKQKSKGMYNIKKRIAILNDMYKDKIDVSISDLNTDGTGTKVIFTLRKD